MISKFINRLLKNNKFNKELYITEMTIMVDKAIRKKSIEKKDFKIFTVNIWTDPDAAYSSISLESKSNSKGKIKKSNEWNRKYYEQYMLEGDIEQAKLFLPNESRNCNPADFELADFVTIKNKSFSKKWEQNTNGECWNELEIAIKEIGEKTFERMKNMDTEEDFELSVNGRSDWYEFTWNKNNKPLIE